MNAYLHGLIIILAFPVVYKILRKRGYLKDIDYNWMAFIWALMTAGIVIITVLFLLQNFTRREAHIAYNKKILDINYKHKQELLFYSTEAEIYKNMVRQMIKEMLRDDEPIKRR